MPSAATARAPPAKSVARSSGAVTSMRWSVATCWKTRSCSAFSRNAAARRGLRSPAITALGSSAAASTASSEPKRRSSVAAVLAPTPGAPGSPSEGSPRRAMKSRTSSGSTPYRSRTCAGPISTGAARPRSSRIATCSLTAANRSRSAVNNSACPPPARSSSAWENITSSASSSSLALALQPRPSSSRGASCHWAANAGAIGSRWA